MPLILLAVAMILIPTVLAICLPLSIIMRYRTSTARRQARGWLAGFNAIGLALSLVIFLLTAGISNRWIPNAFNYSCLGILAGVALGIVGAGVSRWESNSKGLFYKPNGLLALAITLLVAGRLIFGVWRAWHAWHMRPDDESWLAAAGIAGSMSVGALLLGYYFAFWTCVWLRVRRYQKLFEVRVI